MTEHSTMSALFRVRALAVCGTRLWCAVTGPLTVGTTHALRTELTDRCAGTTVVALDLRQLTCTSARIPLAAPWPDDPHTIHVLASESLSSRTADDPRLRRHTELRTTWRAWTALCL
ncbi:hypothetical protein ACIRBZ_16885 [Streptomyces sp. NPDC094038]|uniref:hypothetical protein n=1 Tax=Streptomyces sp. NPDC094038 TaxID=3366055 RepID=UPI00382A6759